MPISSADLHNQNTHDFLNQYWTDLDLLNQGEDGEKRKKLEAFKEIEKLRSSVTTEFNPSIDYVSIYLRVLSILRDQFEFCSPEEKKLISSMIYPLYNNKNESLERIYHDVLEPHLYSIGPGRPKPEAFYRQEVSQKSKHMHPFLSPYTAGSNIERFISVVASEFEAMSLGLPSIRRYAYKQPGIEFRLPTQAQRGKRNIDPLFEGFLSSPQMENKPYVYFNFLSRDKRKFSFFRQIAECLMKEYQKENAMTKALEELENNHAGLHMITLPAQGRLMSKKAYRFITSELSRVETEALFRKILSGEKVEDVYQDFYITPKIKLSEEKREAILKSSFELIGVTEQTQTISLAQRQAVWFDIINYQIPQFVIQEVQPMGYNFSCKNGIDRGGVASAWFNLRSSFETDQPLSRAEFERALHAAPLSTKGRGINSHLSRLWNMINEYVNQHIVELSDCPKKSWLILWRDMHCPITRAADVLELRLLFAKQRVQRDPCLQRLLEPVINEVEKLKNTLVGQEKLLFTLLETLGRSMSMRENSSDPFEQAAFSRLIPKLERHAEFGFLRTILLWFQGKLAEAKRIRHEAVTTLVQNLGMFKVKEEKQEPESQLDREPSVAL